MRAFKAFISSAVIGLGCALAGNAALAADGHEGHDHKPAAGGIVSEIGDYDVELVAADGKLTLLLKNHDGVDQATEGFTASVLVLAGSERKGPFELAPAGGNKLEGAGVALSAGNKAVVTLTDKAGKAAQGRYEAK